MATQPLPLANPAHAAAYRALCDWLMADPALRRTVRLWRAWTGNPDDDIAPALTELPWVRLTPEMGEMTPEAILDYGVRLFRSPMTVLVETAVAKGAAEDSMKLWKAVLARAMTWPYATAVDDVSDVYPLAPAQGVSYEATTVVAGKLFLDMTVEA